MSNWKEVLAFGESTMRSAPTQDVATAIEGIIGGSVRLFPGTTDIYELFAEDGSAQLTTHEQQRAIIDTVNRVTGDRVNIEGNLVKLFR